MKLQANVNFDRFEAQLQVVDAHTVGEFCRVVIGGFPEPKRKSGWNTTTITFVQH